MTELTSAKSPSVSGMLRHAMLWNTIGFVFSQGIGFVIFLLMASRLPPEVFGMVALSGIVADTVANEGRFACMDAIMQAKAYGERALNSAFATFMALSLCIAIFMVAIAPTVASSVSEPLVADFMRVFAVMLLIVPWLAVMDALMMRDLAFRNSSQRTVAASLLGGAVGVLVAYTSWFVWALLIQRIVAMAATAVLEYHYTRWKPGFRISRPDCVILFRKMVALWSIGLLNNLSPRLTAFVFGARFDAATVGLTRAATRIAEIVQAPVISPLMSLWFPVMSRIRGDLKAEREVYSSILFSAAFVTTPAFTGLALVAADVVKLLLPEKYAGATVLLEVTSISFLFIPLCWFNAIAMSALGLTRMSLKYSAINVTLGALALFAAYRLNAPQTLLAMLVPGVMMGLTAQAILNKRLQQSNWQHALGFAPAILATGFMALATWGALHVLQDASPLVRLAAAVPVGAVSYGGWLFLFHRTWLMDRIKLIVGRGKDVGASTIEEVPATAEPHASLS